MRVPGSSGGVASAFARAAEFASPACLSLVLKAVPPRDYGLHWSYCALTPAHGEPTRVRRKERVPRFIGDRAGGEWSD